MTTTIDINEAVRAKIKELPPLPTVVTKLVKIMDNEQSSAEDVTKVLSADQALAGKVLKLVNSSFYGMTGEVSTISRAVVILGFSAVRNLATGLAVAGALKGAGSAEEQQRFWDHAVATAAAAEALARHTDYADPEEAFITGLLHDIGHLLLAVAAPEAYPAVMAGGPDNIVEREEQQLGIAHTKAGHKLLRHWKLPKSLCDVVRFHHTAKIVVGDDDPLVSMVAMADVVAGVHSGGHEHSLDDATTLRLMKRVGLAAEDLGGVMAAMDARIEETRLFLQVADAGTPPPAAATMPAARAVTVISGDNVRMTWAGQALAHFGWTRVSAKAFCGGQTKADVALIDPGSVTVEQLGRLAPLLARSGALILLYGDDPEGKAAAALAEAPAHVPLAFARRDLV